MQHDFHPDVAMCLLPCESPPLIPPDSDARYARITIRGHPTRYRRIREPLVFARQVDPLMNGVAPHGLIGQTADGDGIAIDGAKDDLRELSKHAMKGPGGLKLVYPNAQGEGAIEGSIEDYNVRDEYNTEYKYSRFGASSAPVRNITALSGTKRRNGNGMHAAGTLGDDAVAPDTK